MLSIILWESEHAGESITWMLWVAFGFFGLMVLIGWLTSRKQNKPDEQPQKPLEQYKHE